MRNIAVSNQVWKQLREIKEEEELTHFGDVIKLLITQRKISKNNSEESIKHQPSIRSQLLNLMEDGNTWQLSDIASEMAKQIHRDYNDVVDFVESILESIPEITKVGDAQYRLSEH